MVPIKKHETQFVLERDREKIEKELQSRNYSNLLEKKTLEHQLWIIDFAIESIKNSI
ncbi:MAG: hypothetical protein N3A54_03325 [Patescibacteria group bacterium]|nr:hypothetical protein [Patescibacteria group bacterium]